MSFVMVLRLNWPFNILMTNLGGKIIGDGDAKQVNYGSRVEFYSLLEAW